MEDKRQRILQAAQHLFTAYGVRSTTVEHIAREAKVGKGTLYLYFADKESLLGAVMDRKWQEMRAGFEQEWSEKRGFIERLLGTLKQVSAFRSQDPFFQKIHMEFVHFRTAEIDKGLRGIQAEAVKFIEDRVREGMDAGEISELPAGMLAFLLVKAYAAFIYDWPAHFPPWREEELKRLLEALLRRPAHEKNEG